MIFVEGFHFGLITIIGLKPPPSFSVVMLVLPEVSMNQAESRPLNLENQVFKAFVIILGQARKASKHVPTSSHDIHFIIMYCNLYLGLHHDLA